ncbi:hypothetical protein [Pontibacter chinhatensis]|uniref:Uncharacterized protein n=1 Tax=Pontibacter chinhatensis TaxID=1436961 RepID=A0A1I2VP76_9BACT|nr:hypothetical protein [Pontibacter chinhatensis]SFG89326.1 hypothetical protein SAMN05421739_104214 [Pontibacter chinhatensis]
MKDLTPQERHAKLVAFAKTIGVDLPKQTKELSGYKPENFSLITVNAAVALLVDALRLTGGSVGGGKDEFNLYYLLQAYMLDTQKRDRLNQLVKEMQ